MSKHDKQVRRERKKRNRARRQRAVRTAALAGAAALAAGTSAYAEPVRFDNPADGEVGHFHWPAPINGSWLDVTLDAASQPGMASGDSSFRHLIYDEPSYGFGTVDTPVDEPNDVVVDQSSGYSVLVGLDSGQIIDNAVGVWNPTGYATYVYAGLAAFAEGVSKYLGVRFDAGSGYQYGWIGVTRNGNELEAFAWGYETEPGVPICAGASAEDPNCVGGCVGGDMDDDGDVDADDVPLFVDALLGKALPPGSTDRSDLDACGPGGDGDDVQAFVDKLME